MTDKYLLGIPLLEGSLWRSPGLLPMKASHGSAHMSGSKSGQHASSREESGTVHQDVKFFEHGPQGDSINFTTECVQPSQVSPPSPLALDSSRIGTSSTTALSLYQPLEIHDPFGSSSRWSEFGYAGSIVLFMLVMFALLPTITNRRWFFFAKDNVAKARKTEDVQTPNDTSNVQPNWAEMMEFPICWEATLEEIGLAVSARILENSLEQSRALREANEALSEAADAEKMVAQAAETARKDWELKAEKAEKAKEDMAEKVEGFKKRKTEQEAETKKLAKEKYDQEKKIAKIEKEKDEQEEKLKKIRDDKKDREEKMAKIKKEKRDQGEAMDRLQKEHKKELKKMETDNKDLEGKLGQLEKDYEEKLEILENEKKDVEEEAKKIKSVKQTVEGKVKIRDTTIKNLRNTIEGLEGQIASLNAELQQANDAARVQSAELAAAQALLNEGGAENLEDEEIQKEAEKRLHDLIGELIDPLECKAAEKEDLEGAEIQIQGGQEEANGGVQDDVEAGHLGAQGISSASQSNRKKRRGKKRSDKHTRMAENPRNAAPQQRDDGGQRPANEQGAKVEIKPSTSKPAKRVCPYFPLGTCLYGTKCRDAHEMPVNPAEPPVRPKEPPPRVPSPARDQHHPLGPFDPRPERPVCTFFKKGYCKFGAKCRDYHDPSSLRSA